MNGKAWLGRLLSRKAPDPAKARRKASRRPASPLRELEQEQAALRARLDALGTALDAASVALPEQERTALCRVRDEARAVCGRARDRLAAFRCWPPCWPRSTFSCRNSSLPALSSLPRSGADDAGSLPDPACPPVRRLSCNMLSPQ